MKLKLQLIIESDSGETEVVQELAKLERHSLRHLHEVDIHEEGRV